MTRKMLEDLPEDIIIIILKNLDYRSLGNLYVASVFMQNIILVYKVVKECNISFSTMATVETIKSQFFLDIAHNLLKLNLSGVGDLCRSTLMPIMKKLKILETLDVSYTNINLVDFMDIYKVCPTIKNVAINLRVGKKHKRSKLTKMTLFECQKIFKQFESVHFVGSKCNLLYSDIAIFILALANLKFLQYTIVEEDMPVVFNSNDYDSGMSVNFDHFFVNIPYINQFNCYINIFAPFNYKRYEYLVVSLNKEPCVVYATEVFNKFFQERFDLKVNSCTDINVYGNVCIMLWRKNLYVFDDKFYNLLYNKIKTYIICYTDDKWNATNLSKYDRFCIKPKIQSENSCWDICGHSAFKKQRVGLPNYVLNYDEEFKDKQELQLSIIISSPYIAITLPSNCEYLQKLTYLNIHSLVKYSNNFFNILFQSCVKLVTLNVKVEDSNVVPISRSVPLSHSIKNLRIVGRSIDLNTVVTSLSQCSNLENVHIVDLGHLGHVFNPFDPTTMIEKCSNLYCMYVYMYRSYPSDNKLAKQISLINNAKARSNKMYINFKVFKTEFNFMFNNPYVQVFRLLQ